MVLFIPNHNVTAGFVVRNSTDHPLLAMAKNHSTMEIIIAEAMALRDDLLFIPNLELQNLIVEDDSKALIDAINGKIDIPWRIKFLVLDIFTLPRRFSSIVFHHKFRKVNLVADNVVNLGHSASLSLSWCNQLLLSSSSVFQFDQFRGDCSI